MMLKSYYWVFYLVMISAGSYFLADMLSLAVGSYLESFLEASAQRSVPAPAPKSPQAGGRATQANYRAIIRRNIFNSKKPEPLPEVDLSTEAAPESLASAPAASLPPLNLDLVGTVVARGVPPLAVIRDPRKKGQRIYRKGDLLAGTASISDIHRKKVVVLRGGRKEVLELKAKPKRRVGRGRQLSRRTSVRPPKKVEGGETIRQVSENQWILDRRELDNAMKNLPQLLTKARLLPNFKDGKPDGFRIFAIARDSLYAKIGLQNGDILHRINGVDVKDPQNFMKVMEQLKDESSIRINLVRNNQQQTFNYEIR